MLTPAAHRQVRLVYTFVSTSKIRRCGLYSGAAHSPAIAVKGQLKGRPGARQHAPVRLYCEAVIVRVRSTSLALLVLCIFA